MAIGRVLAHGRSPLTLAPGGPARRGRRRVAGAPRGHEGRRLHRRRRLHGLWTALRIKELEPDADVVVIEQDICGGGPSGRNGGFALTWWSKIQTLIKRVGGRGGRSPRQGLRGCGQRDRRVLRARGCGRALSPGRLALDRDLAGAGRRLGVERGDGRRTRRSSLRNPERGGGAGAHRLSHPSRSGLREDRGDRAARPPGAWPAKGRRRERRPHLRAHADGRARPGGRSRAHAVRPHPGRRRRARAERLGDEDPRARAGDRRGLERHGRDGADGGEAEGKRLDRGRGDLGLPPARPLLPPDEGRTRRVRPRRRAALPSAAASTRTSTTTGARPASSRRSS